MPGLGLEVILGTQPISAAHLAPPRQTRVGRSPGLKPRGSGSWHHGRPTTLALVCAIPGTWRVCDSALRALCLCLEPQARCPSTRRNNDDMPYQLADSPSPRDNLAGEAQGARGVLRAYCTYRRLTKSKCGSMTTARVRVWAVENATRCGEGQPLGRYLEPLTRTRHTPGPVPNGVMVTGDGDGISARPSIAALGGSASAWPQSLCEKKKQSTP